jgi:uncharacterized protein (TIGR03083 family)
MSGQIPILVTHLFRPERGALLALLRSLASDDWSKPTTCAGWSVHDVALHLLGGDIGLVARMRDEHFVPLPEAGSFVEALNLHNEQWVERTRRMSPALLLDFLDLAGRRAFEAVEALDLHALGHQVYWAGPEPNAVLLKLR